MNKIYSLLLAALLAMGVLAGCGTQQGQEETSSSQEQKQEVTLQVEVSKNNGEEMLADEELTVTEGTTLMEIMKDNFQVDESEGFINGLEGISTSEEDKMAWLYTINGEEAMVGANEYEVKQGDKIVFDYHSWE